MAAGGEPGPPRGPHWAGAGPSRSRARGEGPASPLLWACGGQGGPPRPRHSRTASPGKIKEMGGWPTAAASPGAAGLCHLVPSELSFLGNHVMEETLRVPSHLRHGEAGHLQGAGRTPCSRSQGGTGFLDIPEIRTHFVK